MIKHAITALELKDILAGHKKWLESDGEEGRRAVIENAAFLGTHFHNANLKKSNNT